jgi:GTP cyclohydrolase II
MIEKVAEAQFPSRYGMFRIYSYKSNDGKNHIALVRCDAKGPVLVGAIPVRVHSKCLTGDTLGSLRCDCQDQLENALEFLGKQSCGILIYLDQEGRGIGLTNKIKAYALQDEGMDTVEANMELGFSEDLRKYDVAAQILEHLGIKEIKLITNNPDKIEQMKEFGINVVERIPLVIKPTEYNSKYLETKKEKLKHMLE